MKFILFLIVSLPVFFVGCNPQANNRMQTGTTWGVGSFDSNGERIFFTATSGREIPIKMIYPELELRGEITEEETSLYSLFGLKFRVADEIALGLGYQIPIIKEREYDSQFLLTLGMAF